MNTTAATAPLFTSAALWLEAGDQIRPFGSLVEVRHVDVEDGDWLRIVVRQLEDVSGNPFADVHSFLVESTRVYEVFGALDLEPAAA